MSTTSNSSRHRTHLSWLREALMHRVWVSSEDAVVERQYWRLSSGIHHLRAQGWVIETRIFPDGKGRQIAHYTALAAPKDSN